MSKKIFSLFMLAITLWLMTSGSIIAVHGASEWTVKIEGAVSHPVTLTVDDLRSMPRSTVYGELYCYGVFVTGYNWTGVSLRLLLENAKFDQSAGSVQFSAEDGYTIEISIEEAIRLDVIIAYELEGQPLSETLRLVLPGENGNRWIAMINHIIVSTADTSSQPSDDSTGYRPPPVEQKSSTPQPSPTLQPTPTPTPQTTPSPSPTPSLSPPTGKPEPEQSPTALTVIAITAMAFGGLGLAVYFKKRKN